MYGNDGPDVISDYTNNVKAMLKPALGLSDVFDSDKGWSIVADAPTA